MTPKPPKDQEHTACILAIVGSRDVNKAGGLQVIGEALERHHPILVVSGGAKVNMANKMRKLISIDEEAARMAREAGLQVAEFLPTNFHWEGVGGFKERNTKIAETAICLVRVSSTTTNTYGSGWTADHAEMLGKNVERYIVDDLGAITEGNHKPPERS